MSGTAGASRIPVGQFRAMRHGIVGIHSISGNLQPAICNLQSLKFP
jgi:hypothetical protein